MTANLIPTEHEIEMKAAMMPEELRQSFIEGVWATVWTLKIKKDESND